MADTIEDLQRWFHRTESHPAMRPYQVALGHLSRDRFPRLDELQALIGKNAWTAFGQPLRFARPESLPPLQQDASYEREIAASGRVSTRRNSIHDLCNALVWSRFPRLKAAMNQRHLDALPDSSAGRRGPVRDALTLFDECGLIVAGGESDCLRSLAAHDWGNVFGKAGEGWSRNLRVWVVGHANLEKLARPYKAMTGHCLLIRTDGDLPDTDTVDALAADLWADGRHICKPRDLCPLPFMGIPGWWPKEQDGAFYDDPEVFRPPRPDRPLPPVFRVVS